MAHKHNVYDTSLHFIIDGNTRLVKNSTEAKVTLVQYDHNSERITFELPRYIDGHDMSLCTDAQVHYINIERKTNRESTGVYKCDDLQIAPDDENVVICSWLISKNATMFVGSLFFVIKFICSEDREITYCWNTARHTGLSVTDGIYNGEDVDEIVESDAFKIFEETIEAANVAIENANKAAQKANDSIIHIRYSKYADGKDFVDVWTPMYDYIGIATGLTAPTDPSGYQWSRFNAKGYWTGSTEEYNAIPDDEIIDDYLYIPDDDTFFEDLESGKFVVGTATNLKEAPVLKTSTSDGNKMQIDIGGKSSNLYHPPYADRAGHAGTADSATNATNAGHANTAGSTTVVSVGGYVDTQVIHLGNGSPAKGALWMMPPADSNWRTIIETSNDNGSRGIGFGTSACDTYLYSKNDIHFFYNGTWVTLSSLIRRIENLE